MISKIILSCFLCFQFLQGQTDRYAGTYAFRYDLEHGEVLADTLHLYHGGTFHYSSYGYKPCAICSEELVYGVGHWKITEKDLLHFSPDSIQGGGKPEYLLLGNTSLRYIGPSPRRLNPDPVRVSVKFIRSDISWLEGRELFRIDQP